MFWVLNFEIQTAFKRSTFISDAWAAFWDFKQLNVTVVFHFSIQHVTKKYSESSEPFPSKHFFLHSFLITEIWLNVLLVETI